ncbi:MAG: lytic transglycosylase domain-containing protein [Anaerolineae bacterium]
MSLTPTNPVLMQLQAALLRQAAAGLKCQKSERGLSGAGPSDFDSIIVKACDKYGIDPALVKGLIKAESGFDPAAVSSAGAKGLMQLMDGTAEWLGVTDSFDPEQNVDAGVRFLSALIERYDDEALALAAYNAGPGAVDKAGGVPEIAETQVYVPRVLAYRDEFAGSSGWEA